MLEIIKNTQTEAISLGDFVEHVRTHVDFANQASIKECASALGRLHLNRTFLREYIVSGLRSGMATFEANNRYTPPSLVLATGPQFLIRANLWRATDQYEVGVLDLNVYGLAHDHNFDFLTLNYFGPGYGSKMYTYDYTEVSGTIGERVNLRDNGYLTFDEGDMFLYRKNIDVHVQFPPASDSITINVMANLMSLEYPNQYIFDIEKSTIADILGGFHRQKHVFDMALALDDAECIEVMRRIARKSNCEFTRAYLSDRLEPIH
jgi:hypothetical protein